MTCRLSQAFATTFVLEPSLTMLGRAGARMRQYTSNFGLIRGIAETLPFPDHTFDRVLCHSAIDHFADPERGIREMARVVKSDGRLIITFVNYGGVAPRVSRGLYALGRALRLIAPESLSHRLPWDTPVPYEHSFECTWVNVSAMCDPYLELDWAHGVSLGWGFPGWGSLLARFRTLEHTLVPLDRLAHWRPALADFVVTIWRPRSSSTWPVDDYRVRKANPVYQRHIREEATYWAKADFSQFFGPALQAVAAAQNAALTGDPARSWLDDMAARGPFGHVAVLGCDDTGWETDWLQRGASRTLDVYELSDGVIAKVKQRLGALADRVRFIQSDLNFADLPAAAYDCVLASSTLHCMVNLEHVFSQVHRALRPGGLFAFSGWVGENRLQYDPRRLARVNAILARVPERFRRVNVVERPSLAWTLSPFMAARSADILPLARRHPGFDVIHDAGAGWLFPLMLVVDLEALAREHPELIAQLRAAEAEAKADSGLQPTGAYVVLRRR